MVRLPNTQVVSRNGFSLLELLIVLGIIVALASAAAPNVLEQMREARVFQQADEVREAVALCRRFAIETGVDYEFRYEIDGPAYLIIPAEIEQSVDDSGNSTTTEEYFRAAFELEEDMRLHAAEDVEERSESLDSEKLEGLGGPDFARKSWSQPVLFRFDGRADDATVRVSNKDGLTSDITIRGLTGSVRVSQVYPDEDT